MSLEAFLVCFESEQKTHVTVQEHALLESSKAQLENLGNFLISQIKKAFFIIVLLTLNLIIRLLVEFF